MGGFKEYSDYDAIGLSELIRKKEITPKELCEEAIKRIENANPLLNAVVTKMYDLALQSVEELPDGPLKGVPFLLKDLMAAYAGVPLTAGSRAFKDYVPDYDSELVKRFKQSGLVILGKTNTPEFGLMGTTEPELHGPTRNPWNTDCSTGGSSGGSAAAVAAGMTPLASAGDGGGSIRIPASWCGVFGLKPSRGRNPTGPKNGRIWQDAAVEHVITRSVRDSAAVLDATNGPDIGAPYIIPRPETPYLDEIKQPPLPLKIAFCKVSPLGTGVHPECIAAVENAATLLRDLGHTVEEATPPIDGMALGLSYFTMYYGEIAADLDEMEMDLGRKIRQKDVEISTWFFRLIGRAYSAGEFVRALRSWDRAARIMGAFHQTYDIYMTPTTASPPPKIGELMPKAIERFGMKAATLTKVGRLAKASGIVNDIALRILSKTPFTQLANLIGAPAMSVPLHWTEDMLPIGVQFIGPFGDEGTLLRLAAQLEEARPWFKKRPSINR